MDNAKKPFRLNSRRESKNSLQKARFNARTERNNTETPKTFVLGMIVILLGLLTIFVGLFWDSDKNLSAIKPGSYLNTVGTTLLAMGFFQIILDLKGWRTYFEERLISVFKRQDFLVGLDKEELMSIQINALKAYFEDEDIAREGSFFEYYKRHLQRLLEEPYREDVHFSLVVHEQTSNGSGLKLSLIASYVCRRGSQGYIQPNIFWSTHNKEVEFVESFQVSLQHFEEKDLPEITSENFDEGSWKGLSSKAECYADGNQECKNCLKYSTQPENDLCKKEKVIYHCSNQGRDNEERGFCYPLSEKHRKLDRLHVVLKVNYIVPIEDLRIFKIYFLSKNVTFSIHYPNGLDVDFYSFGVFKDLLTITKEKNYYRCYYDSWMLPDTGIAWRLKAAQK